MSAWLTVTELATSVLRRARRHGQTESLKLCLDASPAILDFAKDSALPSFTIFYFQKSYRQTN